jgi:(p)ppGpp synthase/HD superfamily hydrolase
MATQIHGPKPPQLGPRFDEAVAYAARVHADQVRPGTDEPHTSHLFRVARLVCRDGGSEVEAIAAVLHDAAEDQGGRARLWDIRRRFGAEVADLVEALTDTCEVPAPPWRVRKERYLSTLGASSPDALRISVADKLDNVLALIRDYRLYGEDLWSRSRRSRDDVRWYYDELASRFAVLYPGALAEEFELAVAELDRLIVRTTGPDRIGSVGTGSGETSPGSEPQVHDSPSQPEEGRDARDHH